MAYRYNGSSGSGQGHLERYIAGIDRYPPLTAEEELYLARRMRDRGCEASKSRLVTSHLRLVVRAARSYQKSSGQNLLDLIQEGNLGLIKAAEKFDPERGVRFSHYAMFWIKAMIRKYILDNFRMVKVGSLSTHRKLWHELKKEQERLCGLGEDADMRDAARSLGVAEKDVDEMFKRLSGADYSLDAFVADENGATYLDMLPDEDGDVETEAAGREVAYRVREQIEAVTPRLDRREIDVLRRRLLPDQGDTLREIGADHGVTRERIRQLETRLLGKLREHFTASIFQGDAALAESA